MNTNETFNDGSIDAGLYLLMLATPRGVTRTRDEIAFVCGCHPTMIDKIQTRAMRKLMNHPQRERLLAAWDKRIQTDGARLRLR